MVIVVGIHYILKYYYTKIGVFWGVIMMLAMPIIGILAIIIPMFLVGLSFFGKVDDKINEHIDRDEQ